MKPGRREFNVYADALSNALAADGITVAAQDVPSQQDVDGDVTGLQTWLGSLDDNTRQGIDLVTAESPVKAGLADPSVGIVSSIGPILSGFDNAAASISISKAVELIAAASSQAAAAEAQA